MAAYAPDIELWASYSSVNPKVLMAILELRHGWVSGISDSIPEVEIQSTIEDTAMAPTERPELSNLRILAR